MDNHLLLKRGTLKGWKMPEDGECFDLLKEYFKDGVSMSCATDRPDETRKEVLCQLIDKFKGPITNDWTGKRMTKKEAKEYVMKYGQETT